MDDKGEERIGVLKEEIKVGKFKYEEEVVVDRLDVRLEGCNDKEIERKEERNDENDI